MSADDREDATHVHADGETHVGGHGHDHEPSTGALGRIGEIFGIGHTHDAADRIDDALMSTEHGIRAVKISLVFLGVTAALQLVVALASGSVALLADTIHNFSDAMTSIPLWIAFSLGRRAATERHRYGFGRAEDLAGVFIVAMILLSALLAGWQSIERLLHPQPIGDLGWVMAAAVFGFAGNEAVAIYRIREGRRIGSAALVADGLHARTDGFTSLAVLFGALGVLAGYPSADALVGLAITVAILFVMRSAIVQVFGRLMDAVEPELVTATRQALLAVTGIEGVHEVRLRWVGHRLWVQAQVVVDCDRTLADAHRIAERGRHSVIHRIPRVSEVDLHVDPCRHASDDHHEETAHHFVPRSPTASSGQRGFAYARYLGLARQDAKLRAALEGWRSGDAAARHAAAEHAGHMAAIAASGGWPAALRAPVSGLAEPVRSLERAIARADVDGAAGAGRSVREALHVLTHALYETWLPDAADPGDLGLVHARALDLAGRVANMLRRADDWAGGIDLGRRVCLELTDFARVISAPSGWPRPLGPGIGRLRTDLAAFRAALDAGDPVGGRGRATAAGEGVVALGRAVELWIGTTNPASDIGALYALGLAVAGHTDALEGAVRRPAAGGAVDRDLIIERASALRALLRPARPRQAGAVAALATIDAAAVDVIAATEHSDAGRVSAAVTRLREAERVMTRSLHGSWIVERTAIAG